MAATRKALIIGGCVASAALSLVVVVDIAGFGWNRWVAGILVGFVAGTIPVAYSIGRI